MFRNDSNAFQFSLNSESIDWANPLFVQGRDDEKDEAALDSSEGVVVELLSEVEAVA